jgi:hypothetical protein
MRHIRILLSDTVYPTSRSISNSDEYFDCIVKAELPSELTGAAAFLDSAQLDVTLDVCELLAPKSGRDPLSHSLSPHPGTRQLTQVETASGASTPGFPFTPAPQARDTQGHEDFQDFTTGRSLLSSEVKPERHGVSGRSESAYTLWYFRAIRIRKLMWKPRDCQ